MTDFNALTEEHLVPLRESIINSLAEYACLAGALATKKVKEALADGSVTQQEAFTILLGCADALTRDFTHGFPNAAFDRAEENISLFGLSDAQRAIIEGD